MDRDRKILDAAAQLFYERGFHGASVDELGRRAGLSGPTLYRHFAGKNEILAALFNQAMDELVGATTVALEDPHDDLERLIRHHVRYSLDNRHLVNVYQREGRSLVDPWRNHFGERRREYVGRWEDVIGRSFPGAEPAAVSVATQACLGMIFSIAYWPAKAARTPEADHLVVHLVTDGLATLATTA